MTDTLLIVILVWTIAQGLFFLTQIHKLINKVMSRDFYDYRRSEKVSEMPPKKGIQQVSLDIDELAPPPNLGF